MAMTQIGLVILAALATLMSVALFVNFTDRMTRVVLLLGASLLWGIMGLSAFDVRMPSTTQADLYTNEPILPLAYTGIGLAMAVFVYTLWYLVEGARQSSTSLP